MQDNVTLKRFKKFADTIVSSNMSDHMLLEMAVNYVSSEDNSILSVECTPILDGQLSMFDTFVDTFDYEELICA